MDCYPHTHVIDGRIVRVYRIEEGDKVFFVLSDHEGFVGRKFTAEWDAVEWYRERNDVGGD